MDRWAESTTNDEVVDGKTHLMQNTSFANVRFSRPVQCNKTKRANLTGVYVRRADLTSPVSKCGPNARSLLPPVSSLPFHNL